MSSGDEQEAYAEKAAIVTYNSNTRNLSLIFRVKKTQIRIMEDRGYNINEHDQEIKNIKTPEEFGEYGSTNVEKLEKDPTSFWDFLSDVYVYEKDGVRKENFVIFLPPPLGKSFPSTKLNRYIDVIQRTPSINFVDIIYEYPLSRINKTKLNVTNRNITSWTFSDLVAPIVDSYYVGKNMRVISDAEYRELYAGTGIFKSQLPHIRKDDPLAKYWQWTPRMVIESIELGDLSIAVTHTLKHYVITPESITEVVETVDV